MRKRITTKAVISSLLSMILLMTSIPWTGLCEVRAKEKEAPDSRKITRQILEKENTKDTTTFQLSNGKKETVYYGSDVRYEDEQGNLTDYDPSLQKIQTKKSKNGRNLSQYQYENKAGDKKNYMPKLLTKKTPVLMEYGKYQISFAPVYGEKKNQKQDTADEMLFDTEEGMEDSSEDALSEIESFETGNISKEEVRTAKDEVKELAVNVSYPSNDSKYTFTYQSFEHGVKETIELEKAPQSNQMSFEMYTGDLVPRKNAEDEGITFYDTKEDRMVAALEAPYMNDASGDAYSEALSYEIEPIEGKNGFYRLTLTIDEDYLKDSKRQYPVSIDPTAVWTGSGSMWDVYVINGTYKDKNFYDSGIKVMSAGKISQGISRTYVGYQDFASTIKGKSIDKATLTMYETASSWGDQTIGAHRVTAAWKRAEINWTNRPGYISEAIHSVKTTGKDKHQVNFNLSSYVKDVANGAVTNYGIMLRDANETGLYAQFYNFRAASSTYRPKLSVTYYEKPTQASSVKLNKSYVKPGEGLKVTWAGIHSYALKRVQFRVAKYDDVQGKDIGDFITYADGKTLPTGSSGTGVLVPGSTAWPEGCYHMYLRGIDQAGSAGGGYGQVFHVDGTKPVISSLAVKANGSQITTEDAPSSDGTPLVELSVKEAHKKNYTYCVNGGSEKVLPQDFHLPAGTFGKDGEYIITVKAYDLAGNVSESQSATYHYVDNSKASDYEAADAAVKKSYGKAVISWKENGTALPGSIYYEVHRGETKDFTISDSTLMQSAIKNSYCADTKVGDGKTYYYKVRTVKLAKTGKVLESTPGVLAGYVKQDAKSEYGQYLGSKEYRDSVEISTPTGSGTIDKASGNLMYTGDDFDISVGAMGLTLTRTYNSQSDKKGMLGNGWYDTFHQHLYQVGNDIVLQESDGTYVTFEKDGDTYTSKETKDYTLKLTNVVNGGFGEVSPNEESDSVLARTGENAADYKPSHNITVTGEGGEKETEKETSQKTIAVACTLTDKDQNLYKFDSNGFLTAQEDANGNYLLYEYNDQGQLKTVTTSKNQSLTMEYGGHDLLQGITLPDSTKVSYTYDEDGNLTKVSKSSKDGNDVISTPYTYDENGWLIGIKDAKGNSYAIEYQANKAIAFTKPNGEYQSIVYGDGTTSVSVHKSDQTKVSEDSMTYDKKNGKQLSTTTAGGIETTYQYENSQNPLLQTGTQTKVCYQTLDNDKVMFTSDAKVTTTTTYDANENITKEVDETGETTTTTYGSGKETNLPKTEVTKNSEGEKISDTAYTYDEDGNTTLEYEDVGDTLTEYDYDEDGEIIEEISYEDAKSTDNKGVEVSRETTNREEVDHQVEETLNNTQGEIQAENKTIYDVMGREMKSVDENTGEVTETT